MGNSTDACQVADAGDPDVAGLGVTIAFLISIFLAGVTIILLYLRRALSPDLYNSIDHTVIEHLHGTRLWPRDPESDPWSRALRSFLFALSDQQLAAGTSLSLVVYIRFHAANTYSTYSFQMATSTVFMSCLVHMSTLAALPDRFAADQGRRFRLIAMAILAALLMPILVISNLPSFYYDASLSLECAWQQLSLFDGITNVYSGLVAATITLMVIYDYFNRIKAVAKPSQRNAPITTSGSFRSLLQELTSSFLWRLISLAFCYTFGLTNLIMTWKSLPPLSQWSLSFGQLLPLALLTFTFLPAYTHLIKVNGIKRVDIEEVVDILFSEGRYTFSSARHGPLLVVKPPASLEHMEENEDEDIRHGEVLTIKTHGSSISPYSKTNKKNRFEESGEKDTKPDTIEFSWPIHSTNSEVRTPAFMHCEILRRPPQSNSAAVSRQETSSRPSRTGYQIFVMSSIFVLVLFFEELMALILGGALGTAGASIELSMLLVFLSLRMFFVCMVWFSNTMKARARRLANARGTPELRV